MYKVLRNLTFVAIAFAIVVVLLGAFTRLSHAGLGCPDWPGCYGFVHIPTAADDISLANQAFPDQPYEFAKAWPEMVHRYFASTLGVIILIMALLSYLNPKKPAFKYILGLVLLVGFQGALGRWTVTMKLHPGIVMSHLAGGMTTLALLTALGFRFATEFKSLISGRDYSKFKNLVLSALIILIIQILLGGWTSANYAATVCYELPICQGDWLNNSDFTSGFIFWGHDVETYQFGILDTAGRTAIHVTHRIGAIVTSLMLAFLSFRLVTTAHSRLLKNLGKLLAGLLVVQVTLGIFNITHQLPLYNAVAHNGVAALLLLTLVVTLTAIIQSSPAKQLEGAHND